MSESRKPLRYVVLNGYFGQMLEMCDCYGAKKILVVGDHGTLFTSRRRAKSAIARTAAYAKSEGLNWQCERFRIVPVRECE